MRKVTLYRYKREDGGISISPNKPNTNFTTKLRLIADNGKHLSNDGGQRRCKVIDVESDEGWIEYED